MKKTTTRGERFRESVAASYELSQASPAWRQQLEEVVAALDLLEELEDRVHADGLMQDGLHQPVLHPALREIRQARAAVSKMLASLSLNAEPVQTTRSRRAAQIRWGK